MAQSDLLGREKFNLDDPDGFLYCWHDLREEEEIFSTRPQGNGSVMIWVSFGKAQYVL